jgi:hypothetical protein
MKIMRTIKTTFLAAAMVLSMAVANYAATAECPGQGKCKPAEPCKDKCTACEQCKGTCKNPEGCKQKQANGGCKQDPAKCPMNGKK